MDDGVKNGASHYDGGVEVVAPPVAMEEVSPPVGACEGVEAGRGMRTISCLILDIRIM